MTLVPVDTTSALAVSDYLDKARQWLATAVEMTGPAEIAVARAEIATAAEAAKQLNLSKGIREDAVEMVRRAEYAVSRSIRQGQQNGTVRTIEESRRLANQSRGQQLANSELLTKPSPADIAPDFYYNGSEIASLGEASPEQFEQAIESAKEEGNLARANVVRKVKKQASPITRTDRADLIQALADQGYSSRQMPVKVGVTEETVRQIARDFDIEIPADRIVSRTRRLDHTRMVASTVTDLENASEFIENHIDLNEVDFAEADEWISSLTNSIAALTRFRKQIKEKIHV